MSTFDMMIRCRHKKKTEEMDELNLQINLCHILPRLIYK